jgi:hypothetical protein
MKLIRTLGVYRKTLIYYLPSRQLDVPEIRLTGNWLKKWGFGIGDKVTVSKISEGVMIVKKKDFVLEVEI